MSSEEVKSELAADAGATGSEQSGSAAYSDRRAKSEAKNQAVRDSLVPLEPGERPLAVTIASLVAFAMAIANIAGYFLSDHATGAEHQKEIIQLVFFTGVLLLAGFGMWRVKYWAVIGFQTLLGLQIIIMVLTLTRASHLWAALIFAAVIAAASILFWYLIRAMARIQMPESPDMKRVREAREAAGDGDAPAAEAQQSQENRPEGAGPEKTGPEETGQKETGQKETEQKEAGQDDG